MKVGGPATAALSDVAKFVAACKDMNLPFDFVRCGRTALEDRVLFRTIELTSFWGL